jgi:hypothetical protein
MGPVLRCGHFPAGRLGPGFEAPRLGGKRKMTGLDGAMIVS